MREKMYDHLSHTKDGFFNIKTDRGGITDIEFIAPVSDARKRSN